MRHILCPPQKRQQPQRRQMTEAAVTVPNAMRSQQGSNAWLCDGSHQTVENPLNPRAMWQRSRRLGQQKADGRPVASRQGDQGDVEYIACHRQQPRRSNFLCVMYGICSMTLPSQLARRMLPFVQQVSPDEAVLPHCVPPSSGLYTICCSTR